MSERGKRIPKLPQLLHFFKLKALVLISRAKLRVVSLQVFQWYETEDHPLHSANPETPPVDHSEHGQRSYSYATGWFEHRIDSDRFDSPMGHHNPEEWNRNGSVRIYKNYFCYV